MYSYAFLIRPGYDGVELDAMLEVSAAVVDVNFKEWMTAARVWDRINGTSTALKEHEDLLHEVQMMELRSRLDGACDGPFLLRSETELTRESLERVLRGNPRLLQRIRKEGKFI